MPVNQTKSHHTKTQFSLLIRIFLEQNVIKKILIDQNNSPIVLFTQKPLLSKIYFLLIKRLSIPFTTRNKKTAEAFLVSSEKCVP